MRYHTEKPEKFISNYGEIYQCDHVVYSQCTLFKIGDKGLAVIQQRYDPERKSTYWTQIDSWLTDRLYLNKGFHKYFNERAALPVNGIYPTVTIRQIMWALKIKPIQKEPWETVFDRKDI